MKKYALKDELTGLYYSQHRCDADWLPITEAYLFNSEKEIENAISEHIKYMSDDIDYNNWDKISYPKFLTIVPLIINS